MTPQPSPHCRLHKTTLRPTMSSGPSPCHLSHCPPCHPLNACSHGLRHPHRLLRCHPRHVCRAQPWRHLRHRHTRLPGLCGGAVERGGGGAGEGGQRRRGRLRRGCMMGKACEGGREDLAVLADGWAGEVEVKGRGGKSQCGVMSVYGKPGLQLLRHLTHPHLPCACAPAVLPPHLHVPHTGGADAGGGGGGACRIRAVGAPAPHATPTAPPTTLRPPPS